MVKTSLRAFEFFLKSCFNLRVRFSPVVPVLIYDSQVIRHEQKSSDHSFDLRILKVTTPDLLGRHPGIRNSGRLSRLGPERPRPDF
jgi:hypothetical protein